MKRRSFLKQTGMMAAATGARVWSRLISPIRRFFRTWPPETAPLLLEKNEPLKLRVFIDRSVVEVFVNDRQCVAMRVYHSRPDSVGVSMRSQGKGAVLKSLDSRQMKNIYE